jgi:hypothetical protein
MLIGAPMDRKISEAFLSAISWNRRFIADMAYLLGCAVPVV